MTPKEVTRNKTLEEAKGLFITLQRRLGRGVFNLREVLLLLEEMKVKPPIYKRYNVTIIREGKHESRDDSPSKGSKVGR